MNEVPIEKRLPRLGEVEEAHDLLLGPVKYVLTSLRYVGRQAYGCWTPIPSGDDETGLGRRFPPACLSIYQIPDAKEELAQWPSGEKE